MKTVYKKLSSHGSISIPVAVRRELGMEPKDPMELQVKDGKVIISPYQLRCGFCGSTDNVAEFHGKGICKDCIKKVLEKMEETRYGK